MCARWRTSLASPKCWMVRDRRQPAHAALVWSSFVLYICRKANVLIFMAQLRAMHTYVAADSRRRPVKQ